MTLTTVDARHQTTSATTDISSADRPQAFISPTHIQAVAYLNGIVAVDPDKARVLELGCQSGINLLPFAIAYPQAQVIGIDLDEALIAKGKTRAQQYGLTNFQLHVTDLASLLDSDLGQFDYIIIHGVFGLLGGDARLALLAYCRRQLSAKGVVCFSYSTYPGGKTEEILQDALNLHASLAETPEQQQASARAMLDYLSMGMSTTNPQYAAIVAQIKKAEQLDDVSLALKYMQGLNQPCYLLDFNAQALQEGLAYVGEIEPHSEIAAHYGEQVERLHRIVCPNGNKVLKQQYLDFAVGRQRRFSLLVAKDRAEKLASEIDISRLDKLSWAGSFRRVMLAKGLASNAHIANDGIQISTDHELTQRILDVLGEAWPASVTFKQLIFNTRFPEKQDDQHEKNVRESLYALLKQGLPSIHYCVGECAYRKSDFSSLRLLPGIEGAYPSFNYWHESVAMPPSVQFNKSILAQLDALESDPDSLALLDELHNKGLLIGSAVAWQRYFQKRLAQAKEVGDVIHNINPMIMYSSDASGGGMFKASDAKKVERSRKEFVNIPVDEKIKGRLHDLLKEQKYIEARLLAEELTIAQPHNLQSWITLERINFVTGDKNAAIFSLAKVISMYSNAWLVYSELSSLLHSTYNYWHAINLAYKVIRCDGNAAIAWNVAALVYLKIDNTSGAELCLEKALQLLPNDSAILNSMAMVLEKQFNMEGAINYYRQAVDASPTELYLYSNLLFALQHNADIDTADLFSEHRRYGEIAERKIGPRHVNYKQSKAADRVLRIGFVSGDLWSHPVSNFLTPIWNAIDRKHFSLYIYSTSYHYDDTSRMLEAGAEAWHNVADKSDIELFELIQNDEIDVLFDLSGHTGYNRLPMFSMKPAPIQVSWIGYPGTTGLNAVDYRIVNSNYAAPGVLDDQFTEKLIYLPFPKIFEPVEKSPDINQLPALSNGYITFGSFNRISKINDNVLSSWAKILINLPSSKLVIGAIPSKKTLDDVRRKLEGMGVEANQLIFKERMSMNEYLLAHHDIDIMLDCFPYTGGTTTYHAIWMGVPTLTREGNTLVSSVGAGFMRSLHLDEFVCCSGEEYVQKSLSLMGDLERLNQIRINMRERITLSIPNVSPAFYFEAALRKAWRIYCENKPAESFSIDL